MSLFLQWTKLQLSGSHSEKGPVDPAIVLSIIQVSSVTLKTRPQVIHPDHHRHGTRSSASYLEASHSVLGRQFPPLAPLVPSTQDKGQKQRHKQGSVFTGGGCPVSPRGPEPWPLMDESRWLCQEQQPVGNNSAFPRSWVTSDKGRRAG